MGDEVAVGVRGGSRAPTAIAVPAGGGGDPRTKRNDRGAVTAEAATVLPVLVAIAVGLVWLVSLAAAQVRVVDGAREAARGAARGESDGEAVALGRQVAPAGSRFTVARGADRVRVTVVAEVVGPGGLFGFLPGVEVRSEAVAAREPQ